MKITSALVAALGLALPAWACDSCYGPQNDVVMVRNRPRMQPDALSAVSTPRAPLEWGQLNFIHTTDTHGWLEGHLKQQNYGADWGDFVSFVSHMNQTAIDSGVDMLLVDTGDLHDGAGLSDATSPNGAISNPIFENIKYDLLSIGNHELYVTEIAYETFNQFAKVYGDRYLTSNVQIMNPSTGAFEYIGSQYRYFTTPNGLRIMAMGFLYDFTGNSNVSKVIKAATVVNQTWFINAVNYQEPIDLFVVLGHNPPRTTVSGSTFGTYYNAIRKMRPNVPIQIFGGHTHVRDFVVYDTMATGLESGRYCETVGWLSMSGLPGYKNISGPAGLPHPTRPAVKQNSTSTNSSATATGSSSSALRYARRYLDWNRLTFEFHAEGSQTNASSSSSVTSGMSTTTTSKLLGTSLGASTSVQTKATTTGRATSGSSVPTVGSCRSSTSTYVHPTGSSSGKPTGQTYTVSEWSNWGPARRQLTPAQSAAFDTPQGVSVTNEIYADRKALNLSTLYGCAPQAWCMSCAPFASANNIYNLLSTALATVVINQTRADVPRIILLNTGSVRYDLNKGPFTYDDSFIVSPFSDAFEYIPDVPYQYASKMLSQLNGGSVYKREAQFSERDFSFGPMTLHQERELCLDPHVTRDAKSKRSFRGGRVVRRQSTNTTTPGYTTTDDFGTDGDDTIHSKIPYYSQPNYFQTNASFPTDGSAPSSVDLIFLDYFTSSVVGFLQADGATQYTAASVQYYLPSSFTTNSYLPAYAKVAPAWQANVPNCPVL